MNTQPSLLLAITAPRQSGKDTLFQRLQTLNPNFRRWAFADNLKGDLAPFIREHFGIDVWTAEGQQKEIIRPLLISYGMAQRARDPGYWVKQTMAAIDEDLAADPSIIPVVTDTRFSNEAAYLAAHYGSAFRLLSLTRRDAPPPTDEEQKHYREVQAMADLNVEWGGDSLEGQLAHARRVIAQLGLTVAQ